VVFPPAVIVGVAGLAFTVTNVAKELSELQPLAEATTWNEPEFFTTMELAVEPLLQVLPFVAEEVNNTESPLQKVVLPPAEIVGVAGLAFTVTTVAKELSELQPLAEATTWNEPEVFTTMELAVEPLLQALPVAAEEVRIIESPLQKVVFPPAEIVGVDGLAFTVTNVASELSEVQPLAEATTWNEPEVFTTIELALEPLLQVLPFVAEEVRITESPLQKVVFPPAEIVGVAGFAFTVTMVADELSEEHPLAEATTWNEPEVFTTMELAVEPLLQVFPFVAEEVRITESPLQKVVFPPAEIVGVAGFAFTVTTVANELSEVQPLAEATTWNEPEFFTTMELAVEPLLQVLPFVAEEVNKTESPLQKVVFPPAEIVGVDGFAFTVTTVASELSDLQPFTVLRTLNDPEVRTVMLLEVEPLLQVFPEVAEDVNKTESPLHKVVFPTAEIVGVAGLAFTVTNVAKELSEVQPLADATTWNEPEFFTTMELALEPLLQVLPEVAEEVRTTESPLQKVVFPPAVIVGVAGLAFTVTNVASELSDLHPFTVLKTLNDPEVRTVMLFDVKPLLQVLPFVAEEVRTTESPLQKVVFPPAEIVGVDGFAFTVTTVASELSDLHPFTVLRTLNDPEARTVMLLDVEPLLQVLPEVAEDVNNTESPLQKVVPLLAEIVGVDGFAFTVTTVASELSDLHPFTVLRTLNDPEARTVMLLDVEPLLQVLPEVAEEVRTTESPLQKVVFPPAEIVGVDGFAFTVTTVASELSDLHPFTVLKTLNEPEVRTVMLLEVEPLLQVLPEVAEEVNKTESPLQKVVFPPAEIVGVDGFAFTVTTIASELSDLQPFTVLRTLNEPEVRTVMLLVVEPLLQVLPFVAEEVSTTESPLQKVVFPPAEIVGVDGFAFTVTTVAWELSDLHPFTVLRTLNDPEVRTVMLLEVEPLLQVLPFVAEEVRTTDSPLQKVVFPPAEIVGVAGFTFTVTTVASELSDLHPFTVLKTLNDPEVRTVMLLDVEPLLQVLPFVAEEVNNTESPLQKVVFPPAVIVGVEGLAFTVTTVASELSDLHPFTVLKTLNDPEVRTVMLLDVEPLLQVLPEVAEDVNKTESPLQKVVFPPAVIVGVEGLAFTVTTVARELSDLQPFTVLRTLNDPEVRTVMLLDVEPLLQVLPEVAEEVRTTESPLQKVVPLLAVIVGVEGLVLAVMVTAREVSEQLEPTTTNLYWPVVLG
jgi:hypothetical protein